jgi:hypothetical protein
MTGFAPVGTVSMKYMYMKSALSHNINHYILLLSSPSVSYSNDVATVVVVVVRRRLLARHVS